ncbi:hypothetical protein G3570_04940 [Balneolaceae bacterium YR4-1]|uniref:Cyclic nucleotide-binding domain-containing protein n=1 Tax=Halalkalibaculum roseum TaxID=2709311 RepID=A0A6M1T6S6_9BACT|nr:hypothetical protein [Halalkalibaculum roseum]NGP75963.1 hypothetical protein [Halalkalibaculum roseum]
MIKKHLLGFLLLSITAVASAQSLTVNTVDNTSRNGTSIFNLKEGRVSFQGAGIQFISGNNSIANYLTYGVSGDRSLVAFLKGSGENTALSVVNSLGNTLHEFDAVSIPSGDPSATVYPSNNGEVMVRSNIAGFHFYDTFGELITNVSSSSQSEGGESISEAAMSGDGETVVLYTPKIKRDGKLGSQVQYLDRNMNLQSLYFSTERYIKTLKLAGNGQFVIFVTASEGTRDQIHISDRYGNELSSFSTDEELMGVGLSNDAQTVTAYSESRVLILDALTGERVAGTSFRSELIAVDYFPEDNTIVALTGSFNADAGVAENLDLHAIDIERRAVERRGYDGTIGLNEAIGYGFTRLGSYRYKLDGASKHLELRVSF